MLSNMATSLIVHKRITTTVAKAKELRRYVEPLITRSKSDTTHSRRIVFKYLQDKNAVAELFRDVSNKIGERPGGYTRIIKTGNRPGDAAEMCMMELVDYNDIYGTEKTVSKKAAKTTRRGRRKKSASSAAATAEAEESQDNEVSLSEETTEDSPDTTNNEGTGDENTEESKDSKD